MSTPGESGRRSVEKSLDAARKSACATVWSVKLFLRRSLASGLHTRRLDETEEGDTEVRQECRRDWQGGYGGHGRGTHRNEGTRPRAEGGSAPRPAHEEGGWGR